jgi:hypothetical protein
LSPSSPLFIFAFCAIYDRGKNKSIAIIKIDKNTREPELGHYNKKFE